MRLPQILQNAKKRDSPCGYAEGSWAIHKLRKSLVLRTHFASIGAGICVELLILQIASQPKQDGEREIQEGTTVVVEEHDVTFVPNIVHFVRLGDAPLSFIEVVSIRAAWLQQKPDSLMIHCDNCSATTGSENWKHIKDIPRLTLNYVEKPESIFGIKISCIEHASDIVRIRDGPPAQNIGNQIIVAHKRSEFLRLYYESYRKYRPDLWYYNGGELPTQEILGRNPHLVYRVPCDFGVHEHIVITLFEECNDDWRNFTAVHVFFRHRTHYLPADKFGPINFETVGRYKANFGKMARLVLTGSTKLGGSTVKNISLMSAENLDYSDGCGYLCRLMSLLTP
ncbi:hypothetical protein MTO96_022133 [Rhipicephalus appendiculatus]